MFILHKIDTEAHLCKIYDSPSPDFVTFLSFIIRLNGKISPVPKKNTNTSH